MPSIGFSGLTTPKFDVAIDMGNPFLNVTVDGFLKTGTVAATRSLAEDAYYAVKKGSASSRNMEQTEIPCYLFDDGFACAALKKMCKEGAYWGTVAGMYVGMEYGMERIRGTRDWKNAMVGGALTGALISAAGKKNKDTIVIDAITGGAIATASTFINYLT